MSVFIGDDGRVTRNAARSPAPGVYSPERAAAHAQATVAAEGAPDEAEVERVARAIAWHQSPEGHIAYVKRGWVERHWRLYTDHARAAIGALRGVGE